MNGILTILALLISTTQADRGAQATAYFAPRPRDVTMYEVNVRSFSNAGNLEGVTARLDAVAKLHVNVLWLMPIYPVGKVHSAGGLGSPYAVADYDRINPEFGYDEDLRRLIRGAHSRGLAVILDWVANHTAWDNPWLSHPAWYLRNAKGEILFPPGTNYRDVAKLDYTNATMRKAMIAAMQGWIDRFGIDGFRCDAADMVPADFWSQAIASLRKHTPKRLLMLAEGARKDHYRAGFDLTYDWDLCNALKAVFQQGRSARTLRGATSRSGSEPRLSFVTNHDEDAWTDSPVHLFGNAQGALAAFAAAALYGGPPLLYNGEEIGWEPRIPLFYRAPIAWPSDSAVLHGYESLLALRRANAALREGSIADVSTDDVLAFTRTLGGSSFAVLVNLRPTPANLSWPAAWLDRRWKNLLGSGPTPPSGNLRLLPFEIRVLSESPG